MSRRRLARDMAEMIKDPYPNTKLIPSPYSLDNACLLLFTGKMTLIHVSLLFQQDYPRVPPVVVINGRPYRKFAEPPSCPLILADEYSTPKHAYTIKTLAMHLLSMFDGRVEIWSSPNGVAQKFRPEWYGYECFLCNFGTQHCSPSEFKAINLNANLGADGSAGPQPVGFPRPSKPYRTIKAFPKELLEIVLEHLEVQDIVRFAQAWKKISTIVENRAVIQSRGLLCFVTKEPFTRSPLGIGVRVDGPGQSGLESEFDLISQAAFRDLLVRASAYGRTFDEWLPLPLSEKHWDEVRVDAVDVLGRLGRAVTPISDAMDVLVTFMEDHIVGLFENAQEKWIRQDIANRRRMWIRLDDFGHGLGYAQDHSLVGASEKGIQSVFFLFHLLLCLTTEEPRYVQRAKDTVTSFRAHGKPIQDRPSPIRALVALLISGATTDSTFTAKLVRETAMRSAGGLLDHHPKLLYVERNGSPSAEHLPHSLPAGSLAPYRALMFMDAFRRKVRPTAAAADAMTTLLQDRSALFNRRGFPPSATIAHLAAEMSRAMAVDSFAGLLAYLGLLPVPGGAQQGDGAGSLS